MSPGQKGYQTGSLPPYYITTTLTTSYYAEAPKYYSTKASEYDAITCASPSYFTDAPNYYSASCYTTKTTEYYMTTYAALPYYTEAPATTPRLQLLHRGSSYYTEAPATTPRLQLISRPKRVTAQRPPERPITTLPRSTQAQLRRSSFTQSRLTTYKLLLPATLNRNATLILQFTTPQPGFVFRFVGYILIVGSHRYLIVDV
jgi:hypothetical protein